MARILIKNGKVWNGERFFYADVLTDGRKIISIAPSIDEEANYIYDATDKIVSPGLVDIHTHMLGGCGINADMSCIPFGVTAAAEVHAMPQSKERYDKCLKEAKRKGIVIDVGFAANVHADFSVLGRAIENGCIPDTISTDITKFSAYKRGGRYGMTMCMSVAKELGMKEEDIFRSVTSTPSKALGKENEWGYLTADRCADLVVLEYSNEGFDLTDKAGNRIVSKTGYRCVLTIADGELVYRI